MNSKFEDELDSLLAARDTRKAELEKAAHKKLVDERAFVAAFVVVRDTIVKPTFESLATILASREIGTKLECIDERPGQNGSVLEPCISLYFLVDQDERLGTRLREHPHGTVTADRRVRMARFHTSTIGPGRGGASGPDGEIALRELTAEAVEQRVRKVVRELLR